MLVLKILIKRIIRLIYYALKLYIYIYIYTLINFLITNSRMKVTIKKKVFNFT